MFTSLPTRRSSDLHHNLFFSENYEEEFDTIFQKKRMPEDPTIYVTNSSVTDPRDAPSGSSNLFILVNAPSVHGEQNWKEISESYPRKRSEEHTSELQSRGHLVCRL